MDAQPIAQLHVQLNKLVLMDLIMDAHFVIFVCQAPMAMMEINAHLYVQLPVHLIQMYICGVMEDLMIMDANCLMNVYLQVCVSNQSLDEFKEKIQYTTQYVISFRTASSR